MPKRGADRSNKGSLMDFNSFLIGFVVGAFAGIGILMVIGGAFVVKILMSIEVDKAAKDLKSNAEKPNKGKT